MFLIQHIGVRLLGARYAVSGMQQAASGMQWLTNFQFSILNSQFVKDHLGSTRVAFTPSLGGGQGEVVQINAYYPFGAPIAALSWVGTSDNRYKRAGKEYISDHSWNKYDYGWRAFCSWTLRSLQRDPMAEKFPWLSPYSLWANNPIRFIDPTGMEFTEDAWKQVNKLIDEINKRQEKNTKDIAKKQAQIDAGGLSDKKVASIQKDINKLSSSNTELEGVRGEIATLAASDQMYDIKNDNSMNINSSIPGMGESRSNAGFNFTNGVFEMKLGDGSLGTIAHELKHAHQFETGTLSSGYEISGKPFYDQSDEVAAYARGRLFGGEYRSAASIASDPYYGRLQKGPMDINHPSVQNLLIYPAALQKIANMYQSAFRVNGTTYKWDGVIRK